MTNSIVLGNKNPFSQLLVLVGIALLSVGIFSFIPLLFSQFMFGINALGNPQLFSQLENPKVVELLKFMQLMQSLGLFVIPPLFFSLLYFGNIRSYLQFNLGFKLSTALAMILLMLAAIPIINWMSEVNSHLDLPAALDGIENWMKRMESEAEKLTTAFLVMNNLNSLFYNLVLIALVPAIGEELLFRGAFQSIFTAICKNKHWGIWISAALFSAMHMQFYGFVPRMLLGALFGYTLIWTGSMWLPILGHFVNNGTAVLISYLEQKGKVSATIENVGADSNGLYLVLIGFILVGGLLFWIRQSARNLNQVEKLV